MRRLIVLAAVLGAGCAVPVGPPPGDCSQLAGCPACPACPAPPATVQRANPLEPVDFGAIAGWKQGDQAAAWPGLLASCQALRFREGWRGACAKVAELRAPTDEQARRVLEEQFVPWRLANPDGALRPNAYATIRLFDAVRAAVTLPASAVLSDGARSYVYRKEPDGALRRHDITVGSVSAGSVPVIAGLTAADQVVVSGAILLDNQIELDN